MSWYFNGWALFIGDTISIIINHSNSVLPHEDLVYFSLPIRWSHYDLIAVGVHGLALNEGGVGVSLDNYFPCPPIPKPSPSYSCQGRANDEEDKEDGADNPDPGVVVVVVGDVGVAEGGLVGVDAVGVVVAAVGEAQRRDAGAVHVWCGWYWIQYISLCEYGIKWVTSASCSGPIYWNSHYQFIEF